MIRTRRLAAILAADVVGFSALMERDEEGTVRRVHDLRTSHVDPLLQERRGRLVKTTGDGFLAEFASPIAAVGFAIDLQTGLNRIPDGLRLRIGINQGDIIVEEDGDVYGEGVNVAARLEALCEPGGVLVSGKIYGEVQGKVDASFEDQGEQHVKNISKLVHVFAVREPGADGAATPPQRAPTVVSRSLTPWLLAGAAAVAGAGALAWVSAGGRSGAPAVPPPSPAASGGGAPAAAVPAVAPGGQPTLAAAPTRFDGAWAVTITCPPIETPKTAGYTLKLAATIAGGVLQGQYGVPGVPGFLEIGGAIAPDGSARLRARGIVNSPQQAVNGAQRGAPYEYSALARFQERSGTAQRTEVRRCDLVFER